MTMKNQKLIFHVLLAIGLLAAVSCVFVSCSNDDNPPELKLTALTAGSTDLNGATSPTDVPEDATFAATFSTDLDPATVTTDNVKLMRDYDDAELDIALDASGKTITITPAEDLGSGTLYILNFGTGLESKDGKALTPAVQRNFTTEGSFTPAGVIAHWTFEDNADDVVGTYDPAAADVVDITYVDGRKAAAGKAANFNGSTSIIEVPNGPSLVNTDDFTLSFWVKTNSTDKTSGHFVLGVGASKGFQFEIPGDYTSCKLAAQYDLGGGQTASEDLWFNGSGEDKDHGGWQGWDFVKDLTGSGGVEALLKDKWANIVCVYNSDTKQGTMYINGEKMKSQDFNLWPDGDPKQDVVGLKWAGTSPEVGDKLAFGFIYDRSSTLYENETWGNYENADANHFKGLLDDVRIFHSALTAQEVQLMYNSEKP